MTQDGNDFVYTGLWGGQGTNINTKASDNGAEWYSKNFITGAFNVKIGDNVKFRYSPSSSSLSVELVE